MDFVTLVRILFRRWYFVVPAVAIVVFVSVALVSEVEPEYEADASAVLYLRDDRITPGTPAVDRNPFASQGQALDTMALLLQDVVSDQAFRNQMQADRFSDDYDISVDEDSPIISLTAKANTGREAVETAKELMTRLATELTERQDAVGASTTIRIEAQVLTQANTARQITVARNRAIASIVVAGLIVVIGLALLAESLANARRRAKVTRAEWAATHPEEDEGEDEPDPVEWPRRRRRRRDEKAPAASIESETGPPGRLATGNDDEVEVNHAEERVFVGYSGGLQPEQPHHGEQPSTTSGGDEPDDR